MTAGEDPVDALAATLDSLDEHLRSAERVVRRSERNRLSLLHVHAAAGCVVAPLFALMGRTGLSGATWRVARLIPGAPATLALLLLAGSLILGAATWHRHVGWEIVGLSILICWYAVLSISFAAAVLLWLSAGEPGGQPSFYVSAVYAHISVILLVHRRTLTRIRRAARAAG